MSFRYACLALVFAYLAVLSPPSATCAPNPLPGDTTTPPADGPATTTAVFPETKSEEEANNWDSDVQFPVDDLVVPADEEPKPTPPNDQLSFEQNLHGAVRMLKPLKPIQAAQSL